MSVAEQMILYLIKGKMYVSRNLLNKFLGSLNTKTTHKQIPALNHCPYHKNIYYAMHACLPFGGEQKQL